MNSVVVDASTLVDYLTGQRASVVALRDAIPGAAWMHAPAHVDTEALNALRGLRRGDVLPAHVVDMAVAELGIVRLRRWRLTPLHHRIWELRDTLTAYDAAYLALAERLPDPLLLTGDEPFAKAARRQLGRDAVRLIR